MSMLVLYGNVMPLNVFSFFEHLMKMLLHSCIPAYVCGMAFLVLKLKVIEGITVLFRCSVGI
jgi:putative effector of murein hydrolase LrgA (UPF0299 family)